MIDKHRLRAQSDKMGIWDIFKDGKAITEIPSFLGENIAKGVTEIPTYGRRVGSYLTGGEGVLPEEQEEPEDEELDDEDMERQQQIAAGISEPGYADPGMAPEDGEAFDAEAWREAQIQRANDFVAINTRAMDVRDRILLRPIQNRDTLRYGGTSSVPDALPLQLVHSANVV